MKSIRKNAEMFHLSTGFLRDFFNQTYLELQPVAPGCEEVGGHYKGSQSRRGNQVSIGVDF